VPKGPRPDGRYSNKESGMNRLAVLGGTFLVALCLSGCGGNPRDEETINALSKFDNAAGTIKGVREAVDKAVKNAEAKRRKLTEDDFKDAVKAAEKLPEVGKQLLEVRSKIEVLQEKTTEEEKEELAKKYSDRLTGLFTTLSAEAKAMDAALARAEGIAGSEDAVKNFRKALKKNQEEFVMLTKAR
jgi:Zn-dependent oligopeptidase